MIKSYIRRLDATRNHVASNLDESIRGEEGKFVLRNPLNFCEKSQTQMNNLRISIINNSQSMKNPNKSHTQFP